MAGMACLHSTHGSQKGLDADFGTISLKPQCLSRWQGTGGRDMCACVYTLVHKCQWYTHVHKCMARLKDGLPGTLTPPQCELWSTMPMSSSASPSWAQKDPRLSPPSSKQPEPQTEEAEFGHGSACLQGPCMVTVTHSDELWWTLGPASWSSVSPQCPVPQALALPLLGKHLPILGCVRSLRETWLRPQLQGTW